ncbi:MAG: hypothetical protein QCI82_07625 [Candidatus Thermoplasmatota archaeon]|nr:hypothetical protein [Candidatus Thermoplasmatota archaeon]
MKHIFRAYDIRGVWNKDIDTFKAVDIGCGIGAFLKQDLGLRRVVIGHDVRTTSPVMHGCIFSGLLSSGVDVLSTGMSSFGTTMMAGYLEGYDASIYITASHLEPEWNGIKLYYGDGVGFPEEHIRSIGSRSMERRFSIEGWKDAGRYSSVDYLDRYIDFWKRAVGRMDGSKGIGIDCGGGAMCLSAPALFDALGLEHIDVNCDVDPTFSSRGSEPRPEALTGLRDAVVDEGLSFGVAFDGDGDRAVVVDDKGRFLSSDRLGALIAAHLVKEKGAGEVLANVESSMALEDVLVPLGAKVTRIKVGHTFLTLEAKLRGALFGIEKSGHLIIPGYVLFDDAITAPIELLRILSSGDVPLSSLVDKIPQYLSHSEAMGCDDAVKFKVVEGLRERYLAEFENVSTMDGVRVDLDEGWALIRCSNTSPSIRLTAEARDDISLKRLSERFSNDLSEAIGAS